MKKLIYFGFMILAIPTLSYAISDVSTPTKLDIPLVEQEQKYWCWAGATQSILQYYGNDWKQCEIAEFARTHSTYHNYGSENCCKNPSGACNDLNELAIQKGSIQDILKNMASPPITSTLIKRKLSENEIKDNIKLKRPFIILAYEHFIVGYGFKNGNLYYMDPWEGEGYGYNKYEDKVNDKEWYWTLTMSSSPYTLLVNNDSKKDLSAKSDEYKNFMIKVPTGASNLNVTIYADNGIPNILARRAYEPTTFESSECSKTAQRLRFKGKRCSIEDLSKGTYFIKIGGTNFSGATLTVSYTEPKVDIISHK
ncbi:MAG: C39 family peptidase [Candidatus Thiodiazotropha sp.]